MSAKAILGLLKTTASEYVKDNVPRLGAAMAYYTVFSIAPVLIIVIAVAGLAFGHDAARQAILEQVYSLLGSTGAKGVEAMLINASKPSSGILATLIGIVTLLVGASGVFGELQAALNLIWKAPENPAGGFWALIKARFLSLLMVLGMGFLLLVSLVLSATLAAMGSYLGGLLPLPEPVMQALNFVVSFGIITVLFAMIYKILPDVRVEWRDVWMGAAATSLLFTIGKLLIGLYIGKANFASTYGAAGSLVVVLVWVYYSTQILLFGAEFTKVYAQAHGAKAPEGIRQQKPVDAVMPLPARSIMAHPAIENDSRVARTVSIMARLIGLSVITVAGVRAVAEGLKSGSKAPPETAQ